MFSPGHSATVISTDVSQVGATPFPSFYDFTFAGFPFILTYSAISCGNTEYYWLITILMKSSSFSFTFLIQIKTFKKDMGFREIYF